MMSFGGWLQLALIVMKLAGALTWSWWAVFAPAEIILVAVIVIRVSHAYLMKHSPRYALSHFIDELTQVLRRGGR